MKPRERFEGQPPPVCSLAELEAAGRRHWQEFCSTQSTARGLAAPEAEQSPGTGSRQAQPQLYVTVIRHSGTFYSRPIFSFRVPPSVFAIHHPAQVLKHQHFLIKLTKSCPYLDLYFQVNQ